MKLFVSSNAREASQAAAKLGADLLRLALRERQIVAIVVATGTSQLEVLKALTVAPAIAWDRVIIFHLDEYVGLSVEHPASFRRYLWERFHRRLPLPPKAFHYVDGTTNSFEECRRLSALITRQPITVCFAGIGENGHLAFNDPPADFECEDAYLRVELDEACRRQQMGEGWFPDLDSVPKSAISMSVRQILKAEALILTVLEKRKSAALQKSLEGPLTRDVPASIIQRHAKTFVFADDTAASLLTSSAAGT